MTAATATARAGMRSLRVWQRNFLMWRKQIAAALVHYTVDPLLALFALGLGLGALVGEVDGQAYLGFLAPAIVCLSVINVCSSEAMYSAFTRMHMQKTWDAMLNAPMTVDDIVLGEWAWAASKGLLGTVCMLAVLCLFGILSPLSAVYALPLLALFCMSCSAIALLCTSLSPGYEFFMYYFTLYVTPLVMLSGSFFPLEVLPDWMEGVMMALPLALMVDAARDIFRGEWPDWVWAAAALQAAYIAAALPAAVRITRRRLA